MTIDSVRAKDAENAELFFMTFVRSDGVIVPGLADRWPIEGLVDVGRTVEVADLPYLVPVFGIRGSTQHDVVVDGLIIDYTLDGRQYRLQDPTGFVLCRPGSTREICDY